MGIEPTSEAWEASDLAGTGGPSAKNWILGIVRIPQFA
jgi:hypothetical protein